MAKKSEEPSDVGDLVLHVAGYLHQHYPDRWDEMMGTIAAALCYHALTLDGDHEGFMEGFNGFRRDALYRLVWKDMEPAEKDSDA